MNVHYRGNLNAATTFIVASDFDCKRCVDFEKTLKQIYSEYKDKVRFGFINFADEPTLASCHVKLPSNTINSGSFMMPF